MRRAAWLALVCCAAAGCVRHRACRPGTLLVALELDAQSRTADALSVSVTVGGGAARTTMVPVSALAASVDLEVDFSSYAAGSQVGVTIDALLDGHAVGAGHAGEALPAGCGTLDIDVTSGAADLGVPDGPDAACVPVDACPSAGCGTFTDPCTGKKFSCASTCALEALSPPFAAAGQTLYLEGRFSADAQVNFPGAPGVTATVLGTARLSVAVPAGAGMGPLTVTTGGASTTPLAFYRPSFTLGAQPFETQYRQADYARAMPVLDTARTGAAVVSDGEQVYVIGGEGSSGGPALTSVEQALVDADGTLGAMSVSSSGLAEGRSDAAAVRLGSYLYVIGGSSTSALTDTTVSTALNSVERATVAADGSLGPFSVVSGVALQAARYGHAAVIVGSTLYVLGGISGSPCDESAALLSIEQATIAADGTLGPFTMAGQSLISPRSRLGVVVQGTWLYAIGGSNGTSDLATVESAPIKPDGSLGDFATLSAVLGEPMHAAAAFSIGGRLYALGGENGALEAAQVNADGSLGDFAGVGGLAISDLSTSIQPLNGTLIGSSIYIFGGGTPGRYCGDEAFPASISARVQRCSLDAAPTAQPIGAPTTTGAPSLIAARARPFVAVLGGWVYAIGGQLDSTQPDVERAQVQPDGMLGAFSSASLTLSTPRVGHAGAVVGDYVYVAGGVQAGGADLAGAAPLAGVESARLDADGSIAGNFTPAMTSADAPVLLSAARSDFAFVVIGADQELHSGQSLCAFGGTVSGGGPASTIDCAPIEPDGTLGTFAAIASYTYLGVDPNVVLLGQSLYTTLSTSNIFFGIDSTGAISASTEWGVSPDLTTPAAAAGYSVGPTWFMFGGDQIMSTVPSIVQLHLAGLGPGSINTSSSPLLHARAGAATAVVGNHAYVIGGQLAGVGAPTEVLELR